MNTLQKWLRSGSYYYLLALVAFAPMTLCAEALTAKQSEALYQELLKDSQFKAADKELSVAYTKLRGGIDAKEQTQLRDEQRKWLKSRDQAIAAAPPETRLSVAVRMTLDRTQQIVTGTNVSAPSAVAGPAIKSAEKSSSASSNEPTKALTGKGWEDTDPWFTQFKKENPRFQKWEKEIIDLYSTLLNTADEATRIKLLEDQRIWLKERDHAIRGHLNGSLLGGWDKLKQLRELNIKRGASIPAVEMSKAELANIREKVRKESAAKRSIREKDPTFRLLDAELRDVYAWFLKTATQSDKENISDQEAWVADRENTNDGDLDSIISSTSARIKELKECVWGFEFRDAEKVRREIEMAVFHSIPMGPERLKLIKEEETWEKSRNKLMDSKQAIAMTLDRIRKMKSIDLGMLKLSEQNRRSLEKTKEQDRSDWKPAPNYKRMLSAGFISFENAQKGAQKGDAFSMAVLAIYYSSGFVLYEQFMELGFCSRLQKEDELAFKYAERSANLGHPLGMFQLGVFMKEGRGVPRDEQLGNELQLKALKWLQNAKDPYSVSIFAGLLVSDQSRDLKYVDDNKKRQIIQLLKSFADMRYPPAEFNYAMCLHNGFVISNNKEEFNRYFEHASKFYEPAEIFWVKSLLRSNKKQGVNSLQKLLESVKDCRLSDNGNSNEVRSITSQAQVCVAGNINESLGRCVTSDKEGNLIVWDLAFGKPIQRISCSMRVGGLLLADNGAIIALGGEYKNGGQSIRVYESLSGKQVGRELSVDLSGGNYSMAYWQSAISLEANLIAAISEGEEGSSFKKELSAGWSVPRAINLISIDAFNIGRDDKNGYVELELPVAASLDRPIEVCFQAGGRKLRVKTELIKTETLKSRDGFSFEERITSLGPGPVYVFNLEQQIWEPSIQPLRPVSGNIGTANTVGDRTAKVKVIADSAIGELSIVDGMCYFNPKEGLSKSRFKSFCLSQGISDKSIEEYKNFNFFPDASMLQLGDAFFRFKDFSIFYGREFCDKKDSEIWPLADGRTLMCLSGFDFFAEDKSKRGIKLVDSKTGNAISSENVISFGYSEVVKKHKEDPRHLVERNGLIFSDSGRIYDLSGSFVERVKAQGKFHVSNDGCRLTFVDSGRTQGSFSVSSFIHTGSVFKPEFSISGPESREISERLWVGGGYFHMQLSPSGRDLVITPYWRGSSGAILLNLDKEQIRYISDGVYPDQTGSLWLDDRRFLMLGFRRFTCIDSVSLRQIFSWDPGTSRFYDYAWQGNWCVDRNDQRIFHSNPNTGEVDVLDYCNEKSVQHVGALKLFGKHDFLIRTQDHFYMGSAGSAREVYFVDTAGKVFPYEQFDLRLNRPDIVLERLRAPKDAIEAAKRLREKRLVRLGVKEEMLKADFHLPEIVFAENLPAATAADLIEVKVKAIDKLYPLNRFKVYVNNVPINGREGESLSTVNARTLNRTIPIKLTTGNNKIQVSVVNGVGTESLYATAEVLCESKRSKPSLYIVSLGVSNYRDKNWNLRYAAKDAKDVAAALKSNSESRYGSVKQLLLTDKQVIKGSLTEIRKFLSPVTVDDSVIFFIAGHGLLDERYDYYFGTADVDFSNPSVSGISFDELEEVLAESPSLRKSLLIDTCHAGELDEEEKRLLATASSGAQRGGASIMPNEEALDSAVTRGVPNAESAASGNWLGRLRKLFGDGSPTVLKSTDAENKQLSAVSNAEVVNVGGSVNGRQITMNSVGMRGMAVKSVEGAKGRGEWYDRLQGFFVDLRRGGGATILSSSAGVEYALESSEQKNGLFTYALLEALRGTKAADLNNDGTIQISEVGEYVKKRVVELTNGRQTPNVRRVNLEGDFPLATVEK